MSKPILILHGATAFSAQFILSYIDDHPDSAQFDLILAGRNTTKLEAARSKLRKSCEVFSVDLTDEKSVNDLVAKGDVVMNAAGPFSKYHAEALIKACAESGKHYMDLTAEISWVAKTVIPKYDFLASKTGSCILPMSGFDSVPSDICVYTALKTLQQTYPHLTLTTSHSSFSVQGGMGGGTINSMRTMAEDPDARKERKARSEWALVSADGPTPRSQLVYTTERPGKRPTYGAFFFMYPVNRCVVRRSWALSRLNTALYTSSTSTSSEPKHGDDFTYGESLHTGTYWGSALVSGLSLVFFALYFGSGIMRSVVSWLVQPGQGPDPKRLEKGYSNVLNVSKTSDENVQVVVRYTGKGDPGFIHTARCLVESALSLVLPLPKGTSLPPLASVGGVLTPSTALGQVLIERLRRTGTVELVSEVVRLDDGEAKKVK